MKSVLYMHDTDRIALQTLKAVPGFTQVLKAFMKVWNENLFKISNMSNNLRINEKQMPQYYNNVTSNLRKAGYRYS